MTNHVRSQSIHWLTWRRGALAGATIALAALGAGTAAASTSSSVHPVHKAVQFTAASITAPAAADSAAITYVDAHFSGSGAARVLKTEADTEHGIAVYDVRVLAPNGATYVVHVQQSNDAVLSATVAEAQPTAPAPTTAPAPPSAVVPPAPSTSGGSPSASVDTPQPVETPQPAEAAASGTSTDKSTSPTSSASSTDKSTSPTSSASSTDKSTSPTSSASSTDN